MSIKVASIMEVMLMDLRSKTDASKMKSNNKMDEKLLESSRPEPQRKAVTLTPTNKFESQGRVSSRPLHLQKHLEEQVVKM